MTQHQDSESNSAASAEAVVVAVDIGGTKIAAGIVDARGDLLFRDQIPTQSESDAGLFERITGLLDSVMASSAVPAQVIGVGCGGPMTPLGQTVSPLNIPQWRDFPLLQRLQQKYQLPTFIDNDAKALARAEGWVGAASSETDYLAMVVSTGVGGGIVLNGQLLDGAQGNAGHIGHVIVEPFGRDCACGGRGCLEAEVSGAAIARFTGRPPEEASSELRRHCGELVGRAVSSVANLLDLRLAVVAGSVALGFGDEFFNAAQAEADRSARLEFSQGLQIVPSGCEDRGPLLGAAAVGRAGFAAQR
ncbi:MAG: ROK family protein [Microthrixaceae bacterium]